MGEAMDEMDRILAKLFMNLPPEKTSTPRGGPLDLVLRGLMLLLSLATGVLQSARHLLGMLIMKTIPVSILHLVTLSNLVKPCQTMSNLVTVSNLVKTFEQIRRVGRWVTTIPGWTILQRQT